MSSELMNGINTSFISEAVDSTALIGSVTQRVKFFAADIFGL